MVTKVGHVNSIAFKASGSITKPNEDHSQKITVTELVNTTPDFAVKTPQKYRQLGVIKAQNGLDIYSYKLANGHRISIIPMEGSPAIVKNYVNVGSMNETDDIKGISHFLEHMAFNGTNGEDGYLKLNSGDSFTKIDEMGGWTNASTNYALTDYVNSTPQLNSADLEQQIKVIAAMTEDLALTPEMVTKEKSPVSSEIDMILDNPQTIAIDQTIRTLFDIKSSADELVGGSVKHIQNLNREKVLDYYNKYYTPDNMHLVITGDVNPNEVIELVSKNFHSNKVRTGNRYDTPLNPINEAARKDFITDKAKSAQIILGFAGHKPCDAKSTVIAEILAKHLSSTSAGFEKEFKRLNSDTDFGIEKISTNKNNPTFIYYGVNCADDSSEEALKVLFDKFSTLKAPTETELKNIKRFLLTVYNDAMDQSLAVNGLVGTSVFNDNVEYITDYKNILNSITADDINKYIKTYLNMENVAVTVVHPNVEAKTIYNNYEKAKNLCFKGKQIEPLNMDKVSETTLNNNYKVGFIETKNENIKYKITMRYKKPKNINPAASAVLDDILSRGTSTQTEEEFKKFEEDNNILIGASAGRSSLAVSGSSDVKSFTDSFNKGKELLYNPRITEKELSESIKRIQEKISLVPDNSELIYLDYESANNPLYTSRKDLLEGLNTLTLDDVKNLHKYILENSVGYISMNIPEADPQLKEEAINAFNSLNGVNKYSYKQAEVYKENEFSKVITKAKNVSQADISQIYKFKTENSIKEKITASLMNSILSSSDSIGLFNSLREKDHLAYRVHSNISSIGNCYEVKLNILTSTDNKDNGSYTYDNVQKSINGFNRQINKLVNSEYTDNDLETAKRTLKAKLLNKESVSAKLLSINKGLTYNIGLDYDNQLYNMIDSITRKDIDELSARVFSNKPVYSVVASQDTLDYNADYFKSLEG